jgi:hypothetical protein
MMQMPDMINGCFELLAGVMILNHCRVLIKDKSVAGVSVVSNIFFVLWGGWNLYYYPHLGQVFSFYGGISIMVANAFWVILMFKYRRRQPLLVA